MEIIFRPLNLIGITSNNMRLLLCTCAFVCARNFAKHFYMRTVAIYGTSILVHNKKNWITRTRKRNCFVWIILGCYITLYCFSWCRIPTTKVDICDYILIDDRFYSCKMWELERSTKRIGSFSGYIRPCVHKKMYLYCFLCFKPPTSISRHSSSGMLRFFSHMRPIVIVRYALTIDCYYLLSSIKVNKSMCVAFGILFKFLGT